MTTYKQSTRKTASENPFEPDTPGAEPTFAHTLSDSAQQIWLAGVGAMGRAQAEGSKLFDSLVAEGRAAQQESLDEGYAGRMRNAMESGIGQARERATGTWDRMERAFEQRVQRTLDRFDVPSRSEMQALKQQVDELTTELRKANAARATAGAAKRTTTARKPSSGGSGTTSD